MCPTCGAPNPDGKRFCGDCGQLLVVACAACGSEIEPGKRFCGDCGTPVATAPPGTVAARPAPSTAPPAERIAERRLTTILFGDLVGYTTLSESRDAEDMRELLSQYFAMATKVVERYGGTIEKFIGDAVMAVWGVPIAHEDDAERAVRAGLDLIDEIAVLAGEVGLPELDMRVGILTGEVAVTLGAVGEGMVAGDAVNTAARIQSAAAPHQVWVDDLTRSLTSAAVTFTDAGEHRLKGKAEPLRLHRAGQVVAAVGGAQRVDGLEAPFVGRDHELRLVKELFHGAVTERRARLVAVSGLAGVGKTRLGWELEKYIDGISETVRWHRGRVLSYGDGVSFWAIAEMVRSRLDIIDGDLPAVADAKMAVGLEQYVDADERAWLQPRLGALLGLGQTHDGQAGFVRDDLFAAWATFFERVSEGDKGVVLVIDDMQHADPDLLDFLDHIVDTARFPLFVFTMARPDLVDRRPGWGSGRRATSVHLEPLGAPAMTELVDGLVAGLPEAACRALVESAEGIPLYALEMVRALIDRDVVVPRDGRYVLAPGAAEQVDRATLDAPPSLHALIAARLDALTSSQRQLVQDAAVHGLAFSRTGIESVSDVSDLDAVLGELVRKEIFELHTDRFSAERGQYRFVQALVRTVAYDTLSRRDRKARHLKVARYLEETSDSEEFAAVTARHYLDAADSATDDPDSRALVAAAVEQLERAARRAVALGSPDEALRHHTTALGRDLDAPDRARILEGAAFAAQANNRMDEALEHGGQARAIYEALGRPIDAGRAAGLIGEVMFRQGRLHDAVELMRPIYDSLLGVPDAEEALLPLASSLARVLGTLRDSASDAYNAHAAQLAEAHLDWARLALHLNFEGVSWQAAGRPIGAIALFREAVDVARREHLPRALIGALANLCAALKNRDLEAAIATGREAVAVSRQAGARDLWRASAVNLALACWLAGEWDEVESLHSEHLEDLVDTPVDLALVRALVVCVRNARAEPVDFELVVPDADDDPTAESVGAWMAALVADAEGDVDAAAQEYARGVGAMVRVSGLDDDFGVLWPLAVDCAIAAGHTDMAQRLLTYVEDAPVGLVTPLVRAHVPRVRALIGIAAGADDAVIDADLELATRELRGFGARFYLARTLLERAGRLAGCAEHDAAAELRREAEDIFGALRADRWLAEARGISVPL